MSWCVLFRVHVFILAPALYCICIYEQLNDDDDDDDDLLYGLALAHARFGYFSA